MMWGRLAPPLGRPASRYAVYKTYSFYMLLASHTTTIHLPKSKIPEATFVVLNLLGRSSVGVRKSVRKFGCESSAKILRKRSAAEI